MIPTFCTQVLLTLALEESSHKAILIAYERTADGKWEQRLGPFDAVIGRKGITRDKQEGDGKTPAGAYPLLMAFGKEEHRPPAMPFIPIDEHLEGVDDSTSKYYNQIVDRRNVEVDWKSSEKMQEIGFLYDIGVFIGYNTPDPVPGKGSCIFLHVYRSKDSGTAGCTALSLEDMKTIVQWLREDCKPYILQLSS